MDGKEQSKSLCLLEPPSSRRISERLRQRAAQIEFGLRGATVVFCSPKLLSLFDNATITREIASKRNW